MSVGEDISIQGGRDAQRSGSGVETGHDDGRPAVDVVLCTRSATREPLLRRAVASVLAQAEQAANVIVVVDHAPDVLDALGRDRSLGDAVTVCANIYEPGLPGARNTGLGRCTSAVVAFLDDDSVAEAGWISAIRDAHADPEVVATSGFVDPDWEDGSPPDWLPEEFWWTVGCSDRGRMVREIAEMRNPIAANMSFRRSLLAAIGGFRSELGRVSQTPLGCEEAEAAIRLRTYAPWGKIVRLRDARVSHFVPRAHTTWSYFRTRCLAAGQSNAVMTRVLGRGDGVVAERRAMLRTLPSGAIRDLDDMRRGDRTGLRRAGAIVAGASLTSLGYLSARVQMAGRRAASQVDRGLTGADGETPILPIPTFVVDLDDTGGATEWTVPPLSASPGPAVPEIALVLVRWHGDPIAYLRCHTPDGRLNLDALRQDEAVRRGRAAHEAAAGCSRNTGVGRDVACAHRRSDGGDNGSSGLPRVTVAIPTVGRVEALAATLASVRLIDYPHLEILVVDNRPASSATRELVAACHDQDARIRYVAESFPGSSAARNRAIAEARGEIICFTDDDVFVASDWVRELIAPLVRDPSVGVTTGLVLPQTLETRAQYLLESYGFGKGLSECRYDLGSHRPRGVFCYPYWGGAFGCGPNMAIRRDLALRLEGFDLGLGAGTPGLAGEDMDLLTRTILSGAALVYTPRAICLHEHNRTDAAFSRQMWSYGVALGNVMTKWMIHDPRFLPAAARSLIEMRAERSAQGGEEHWGPRPLTPLPARWRVLERAGTLAAPVYYIRASRWARRAGRQDRIPQLRRKSTFDRG